MSRVAASPHSSVTRRAPFSRAPVLLVANAFGTWLSQALANLIKARGYRVHFVLTGRELLDHAPAVRPDVIVLDADLPDLDSVAVCRTLRQNRVPWDMPVIMITATPATAPEGAARMARRLSRVLETAGPRPAGVPPLRVHAGYDAVADVHQTPVEPASLLEHAGTALRQARAGSGERIQAYRP